MRSEQPTISTSQSFTVQSFTAKSEQGLWANDQQRKPIFGTDERHIILFAYNKQKDENSPQEIMVMEQPKKKYKKEHPTWSYIENASLHGQTEEKLFLEKVDPLRKVQIAAEIKEMLSVSNQLTLEERYQRRRQIFQSSKTRTQHQRASQEVLTNRIIRVVKMDSLMEGGSITGVVQLGMNSVQQKMLDFNESQQDYYTLVKKLVRPDQVFPQIQVLNNEFLSNISYELDQPVQQYPDNDDQYDSNESDNPKFDYPEEENSEGSQEGKIPRDYDSDNDLYRDKEGMEEDEEEVYRRYLRKLKKKELQKQHQMDAQEEYQEY